jgi:hypothetical protein
LTPEFSGIRFAVFWGSWVDQRSTTHPTQRNGQFYLTNNFLPNIPQDYQLSPSTVEIDPSVVFERSEQNILQTFFQRNEFAPLLHLPKIICTCFKEIMLFFFLVDIILQNSTYCIQNDVPNSFIQSLRIITENNNFIWQHLLLQKCTNKEKYFDIFS